MVAGSGKRKIWKHIADRFSQPHRTLSESKNTETNKRASSLFGVPRLRICGGLVIPRFSWEMNQAEGTGRGRGGKPSLGLVLEGAWIGGVGREGLII